MEKEVLIPKRAPSLNQWKNKHWSVYHKLKGTWSDYLSLMLMRGDHRGLRRYIDVVAYQLDRNGFYDQDNLDGGFKPVLDVLKDLGWIYDDTKNWVEVRYNQRVVGEHGIREESTFIRLYEPGEAPVTYFCEKCMSGPILTAGADAVRKEWELFDANGERSCSCGNVAEYAVQLTVWELDHGRGEKTRKKTLQAKKTRTSKEEISIPRSPQHQFKREGCKPRRKRY